MYFSIFQIIYIVYTCIYNFLPKIMGIQLNTLYHCGPAPGTLSWLWVAQRRRRREQAQRRADGGLGEGRERRRRQRVAGRRRPPALHGHVLDGQRAHRHRRHRLRGAIPGLGHRAARQGGRARHY
jgi:hypothetical protein